MHSLTVAADKQEWVQDHQEKLRRLKIRERRLLEAGAEPIIRGCMSFGFRPFADELGSRLEIPSPKRCSVVKVAQ